MKNILSLALLLSFVAMPLRSNEAEHASARKVFDDEFAAKAKYSYTISGLVGDLRRVTSMKASYISLVDEIPIEKPKTMALDDVLSSIKNTKGVSIRGDATTGVTLVVDQAEALLKKSPLGLTHENIEIKAGSVTQLLVQISKETGVYIAGDLLGYDNAKRVNIEAANYTNTSYLSVLFDILNKASLVGWNIDVNKKDADGLGGVFVRIY